mmetsp:Transcript_2942/g.4400  ORF Transcript_2942/g.4400 Transcript_2942/m.4400 type:complete len:500 (-) Transcript_2942:256-1755(-)|eukprot:CAMPEP_0178924564 /NCGR_PEP_ID=MMETSP0786-20121207/17403_1 /TAXON_ID=186022 /ORGANISM="Thalassionema frauenfeldii, Strain CCMP 1798" /LENGTH=499 /DNA_ID=CAMNT_0020599301 /DNA_START=132 /DNA_END=1631 /DNA_ORIENTATION=+
MKVSSIALTLLFATAVESQYAGKGMGKGAIGGKGATMELAPQETPPFTIPTNFPTEAPVTPYPTTIAPTYEVCPPEEDLTPGMSCITEGLACNTHLTCGSGEKLITMACVCDASGAFQCAVADGVTCPPTAAPTEFGKGFANGEGLNPDGNGDGVLANGGMGGWGLNGNGPEGKGATEGGNGGNGWANGNSWNGAYFGTADGSAPGSLSGEGSDGGMGSGPSGWSSESGGSMDGGFNGYLDYGKGGEASMAATGALGKGFGKGFRRNLRNRNLQYGGKGTGKGLLGKGMIGGKGTTMDLAPQTAPPFTVPTPYPTMAPVTAAPTTAAPTFEECPHVSELEDGTPCITEGLACDEVFYCATGEVLITHACECSSSGVYVCADLPPAVCPPTAAPTEWGKGAVGDGDVAAWGTSGTIGEDAIGNASANGNDEDANGDGVMGANGEYVQGWSSTTGGTTDGGFNGYMAYGKGFGGGNGGAGFGAAAGKGFGKGMGKGFMRRE